MAGYNGSSWEASKFAFERFQALQKGNPFGDGKEVAQSVSGETLGWKQGNEDFIKYINNAETQPKQFRGSAQ